MKKHKLIKKREYWKRHLEKSMRRHRKKKRKRHGYGGYKNEYFEYRKDVYYILKAKWLRRIPKEKRMFIQQYNIPQIFTIADNVDETISLINIMFRDACNMNVREQSFDYRECIDIDLAASMIMDTVLIAAQTRRKSIHQPLNFSGVYGKNSHIEPILENSGIIEHLHAVVVDGKTQRKNLKLFKMRSGKHGDNRSDITATHLNEYFQACLKTQGYRLNDEGMNYLGKMFGEVINNCEIHGGEGSVWYTSGFYQNSLADEDYGKCQMVIFNYGDSVFERLLDKSQTSEEMQLLLQKMHERHRRKYDSKWNQEALYTVLSLQEGISRLKDRKVQNNKKRGTGTIRLLESFMSIGKKENGNVPKLDIISGHIHIKVNEKYQLLEERFEDDIMGRAERKIIAFNPKNDIYDKADSDCVEILNSYFPGTIIAMNFYLDRKYLSELVKR